MTDNITESKKKAPGRQQVASLTGEVQKMLNSPVS
jgi:hypothetical protein